MTLAILRAELDRAVAELVDADMADAIGLCAATQARLLARMTAPPAVAVKADGLVDAAEMARRASLPEHWIRDQGRKWIRTAGAEGIPCVKPGHYMRFDPAAVLEAIRHNRMATPEQSTESSNNSRLRGALSTGVHGMNSRRSRSAASSGVDQHGGANG